MKNQDWAKQIPVAVTLCDTDGAILYMNDRSMKTFADSGGEKLIGKNLINCHSEASITRIHQLLADKTSNVYTIEKNSKKKMIVQTPWYENGSIMGLVEFSIELPEIVPHFIRD